MTQDHHREAVKEIAEATLQVGDVDLSLPESMEVQIAAQHRQAIRNTAVLLNVQIALARKRQARDEVRKLGQQLDRHIKDLAQLDLMFPMAKGRMKELDHEAALASERTREQEEQDG